jgi:hypothetical protein
MIMRSDVVPQGGSGRGITLLTHAISGRWSADLVG